MENITRLRIHVGLLSMIIFLIAAVGSLWPVVLLVGYVLYFESNAWLKRNALTALLIMLMFAMLGIGVDIIGNIVHWFVESVDFFFNQVDLSVGNIFNVIREILNIAEKLLLVTLGFLSIKGKTVHIPMVDNWLNRFVV